MSARRQVPATAHRHRAVGRRHRAWRSGAACGDRVSVAADPGAAWPGLAARAMRRTPGMAGGGLAVALLPPLVEVGRLDLPPLDGAELTQLLSRNAGRYFVGARARSSRGVLRRAAGARPRAGSDGAAPGDRRAASGGARRRLAVALVTPAEAAWAAGALRSGPRSRAAAHVLVHEVDRTVLLELDDGRP